ncbi:HU family DNA-binding protein [Candidatus Phytoplasma solani]|uniref:DNA-binding protein HU n=1 Tax=Candidatus Phytoplasma solani TaxID=69896 RepID=A0A421NU62_9MOLU|nr:HU family DNA-binding protein [Candidatus Phytoplasma solani]RMI87568.1 DNA-binding protein HU [Candidatus Phytoplasma solani]
MTKKELIRKIAEVNETSITQTEEFYNSFEFALNEAITTNEEVVLSPQIGKFILKSRKAQIGHNPQTGEKIQIPAKTVVTFKLSKPIKDAVKKLELN